MTLTGKDVAEIARLLDASRFTALDLTMGDFRLRIRRGGSGLADDGGGDESEIPAPKPAPPPAPAPSPDVAKPTEAQAGEVDVLAPLLGNFYVTPRPGEPPFVSVGDRVGENSIVAIIEVMKLMNSVRAGVAGVVTAVLVENGNAVEAGQPLVRVRRDA